MEAAEVMQFATDWVSHWNRRDPERVLAYYADDIVFTSPTALRVVPETGGGVRGKEALRAYWLKALEGNVDLRFTLLGVFFGVETVALHYLNQAGEAVIEVMTFSDGLISVSHATHALENL